VIPRALYWVIGILASELLGVWYAHRLYEVCGTGALCGWVGNGVVCCGTWAHDSSHAASHGAGWCPL